MPAVIRLGVLAVLASVCLASCGGSDGDTTGGEPTPGCSNGRARGAVSELRYRVESTPGAPGSFAETTRALCRRLSRFGITSFAVRQDRHELLVRVPRRLRDEVEALARPGRIVFLDWEPNVLGPRGPDSPFGSLFEAVKAASGMAPSAEPSDASPAAPLTPEESDRRNNAFGELHYLFGSDGRLLAGPAAAPGSLATARAPAGSRTLKVVQGIAVVAAPRSSGDAQGWFVIEDDTELSRSDIAGPRAETEPRTKAPAVVFDFTGQGRAAFSALTRRVVQRGAPGAGASPRIAIVLDGRVVSFVTVDPAESPEGLDGRAGAQLSDVGSRRLARRLARLLREDPLPANLVPLFGEG